MSSAVRNHSSDATKPSEPSAINTRLSPPLTDAPLSDVVPVELPERVVAVALLDEPDLVPVALDEPDAPPDADADDWPAGATAATFATAAHVAAEFADASPCLYGRKDNAPVLSSWTSAVMLAA